MKKIFLCVCVCYGIDIIGVVNTYTHNYTDAAAKKTDKLQNCEYHFIEYYESQYRIAGKFSGKVWWEECLANLLFSSVWRKKVWQMNRSAKGLLIVITNLDGFSLANCRRFAKFAKHSPCQTFPLYGKPCTVPLQC